MCNSICGAKDHNGRQATAIYFPSNSIRAKTRKCCFLIRFYSFLLLHSTETRSGKRSNTCQTETFSSPKSRTDVLNTHDRQNECYKICTNKANDFGQIAKKRFLSKKFKNVLPFSSFLWYNILVVNTFIKEGENHDSRYPKSRHVETHFSCSA